MPDTVARSTLGRLGIRSALATRVTCAAIRIAGAGAVVVVVLATARQISPPTSLQSQVLPPTEVQAQRPRRVDWKQQYPWLSKKARQDYQGLVERIDAPPGFSRVEVAPGSFAEWLRHLPVAPDGTPVTTGRKEVIVPADDRRLAAAIALQPHRGRLLDAVNMLIRLRGEYRWSTGAADGLAFHFTNGNLAAWSAWADGVRPFVEGRQVEFRQVGGADAGRDNFCCYLESVFRYSTVYSLWKDTHPADDKAVGGGDVFVKLGRPGHAVIVLDAATDEGVQVRVLLGQGGTPPQTFHALRDETGSPWFAITQSEPINLGRWGTFSLKELRHWNE